MLFRPGEQVRNLQRISVILGLVCRADGGALWCLVAACGRKLGPLCIPSSELEAGRLAGWQAGRVAGDGWMDGWLDGSRLADGHHSCNLACLMPRRVGR